MIEALATSMIVAALVVAAWAFLQAARNREPDRWQFIGLIVVGALTVVQSLIVFVRLAMGHGPDGSEHVTTMIGYTITTALVPGAGFWLARMEPTRYGSALAGGACLVLAILVVRLGQVWSA